MNKIQIGLQITMDRRWRCGRGWFDRIIIRLCRKTINRVCKYILCRGMERGIVGPMAFHELVGICNHVLWPERYDETNEA